jgi:DNA-binding NtrC family response regulator
MRILVVDDDAGSRSSVAQFLKKMKQQVTECANVKDALTYIQADNLAMVFSDIKMPELSGLDLLREISKLPTENKPKVVFFTGHGTIDSAIEALRMGAFDYLLKPVKAEEIMAAVNRIKRCGGDGKPNHSTLRQKNPEQKLADYISLSNGTRFCMGSSKMQHVITQALKYSSDHSIPVLIQGETGTGKELVARLIHEGGNRTDRPFVDINCAAIQPTLFESELFGYKAGAFTGGMNKDQKGKFDLARGGTIFLDELAEIPIDLQAKLLRVVQEREYYRVGGVEKITMDARIICATNVKLPEAVDSGKFRRDLFYRLQVGHIIIPPLRERKEDILGLAEYFLAEFSKQRQKEFASLSKEVQQTLLNYNWPGNIRELRNVIEWAVLMHNDKELKPQHLQSAILTPETEASSKEDLDHLHEGSIIEKHTYQLINDALHKTGGNKAAAARYLGISRRALYRLLEKASQ